MTKEEYDALQGKEVQVDAQEFYKIKTMLHSLRCHGHSLKCICPNCYEAYIIDGYLCPVCGYDDSYSLEEWRKEK